MLLYLIFEAGARYRYDPMIILVLTSTFGMMRLGNAQGKQNVNKAYIKSIISKNSKKKCDINFLIKD